MDSDEHDQNRELALFADSVEAMGLEPTTYGLQSRRSSQLSYAPVVSSPET